MNRVGSVQLLLLSELCAHNALESMQMPTKARTEAVVSAQGFMPQFCSA